MGHVLRVLVYTYRVSSAVNNLTRVRVLLLQKSVNSSYVCVCIQAFPEFLEGIIQDRTSAMKLYSHRRLVALAANGLQDAN